MLEHIKFRKNTYYFPGGKISYKNTSKFPGGRRPKFRMEIQLKQLLHVGVAFSTHFGKLNHLEKMS